MLYCICTNELSICIAPPPEITSHPMNMIVNNGSNVTFNCVSFSYVPVTYTWLKDGVTLLDDDVNIIISTVNDEDNTTFATTLMILDVQLSDNGVYVCNATNGEGITFSNVTTLSVLGINNSIICIANNYMHVLVLYTDKSSYKIFST